MIGQFVTSKAGHDCDGLYVIVATEGDYVYLCDGKYRTISKPKKKNRKHIQPIGQKVDEGLLDKLINHEKVMDEQIKYAIKNYRQ